MPYLQLDVPNHYPVEVKRGLARRLGEKYARIMQTTPDMVTVAFRELGEGGVWRCNAGEPEPATVLSCDIRRGRLPEQRAELAEALIDACVETLGLRSDRLVVEFTQHTRDEMYRAGRGWAVEWTPFDCTIPLGGDRGKFVAATVSPPIKQPVSVKPLDEAALVEQMTAFIKQAPRTWYEILQHFAGQPYPPVYRAFGKLRPKLGRRVDLVPAFPYTFADTEFVQGDGRPE